MPALFPWTVAANFFVSAAFPLVLAAFPRIAASIPPVFAAILRLLAVLLRHVAPNAPLPSVAAQPESAPHPDSPWATELPKTLPDPGHAERQGLLRDRVGDPEVAREAARSSGDDGDVAVLEEEVGEVFVVPDRLAFWSPAAIVGTHVDPAGRARGRGAVGDAAPSLRRARRGEAHAADAVDTERLAAARRRHAQQPARARRRVSVGRLHLGHRRVGLRRANSACLKMSGGRKEVPMDKPTEPIELVCTRT